MFSPKNTYFQLPLLWKVISRSFCACFLKNILKNKKPKIRSWNFNISIGLWLEHNCNLAIKIFQSKANQMVPNWSQSEGSKLKLIKWCQIEANQMAQKLFSLNFVYICILLITIWPHLFLKIFSKIKYWMLVIEKTSSKLPFQLNVRFCVFIVERWMGN